MRDRIFKAFAGVDLNETRRKAILYNVLDGSVAESDKRNFWQGKAGGAVIVAAAALVFVVVNMLLIGGKNIGKTPLNNSGGNMTAGVVLPEEQVVEQSTPVQLIEEITYEPTTVAVENESTTELTTEITTEICSYPLQSNVEAEDSLVITLPVVDGRVTAGFGFRYNVMHYGVDFAPGDDLNVYAVLSGKVIMAEYNVENGNTVKIDHGNGIISEYSCLESMNVLVGADVNSGDVIGIVGNTGYSTGIHLCWKMCVNGEYVDPMSMIK